MSSNIVSFQINKFGTWSHLLNFFLFSRLEVEPAEGNSSVEQN